MKKLLLAIILMIPINVHAQLSTAHLSLQPTIDFETIGFSVGGSYAKKSIGVYGLISMDLGHKVNHPNLETGLAGNAAVLLRQTDESDDWFIIAAGPKYQLSEGLWIVATPGLTFYSTFTQHDGQYWVKRDDYTQVNFGAGTIMDSDGTITINLMAFTNPAMISFGIGFRFNSSNP